MHVSLQGSRAIAMNTFKLVLLFAALLMPLAQSRANDTTAQAIQDAVESFVTQYDYGSNYPVELGIKPLDKRLRLRACPVPLQARFRDPQRVSGNTHVQVDCATDTPWKMHVAVTVRVWTDAVVAAQPIARGATVSEDDLRYLKVEKSQLYHGHFTDIKDVVGLAAAMPLRNDQVVNSRHLRAPYLVNKGQRVTILAISGNIAIRANGTAMANASRGQSVTVRNTDSGRMVDAVAVDTATVRVPL